MKIQKSSEDYLEAMLMLKQSRGYIRSSDIADQLNVTRPSVSPDTARRDACKIEHDISEETFDALCRCANLFAPEKNAAPSEENCSE